MKTVSALTTLAVAMAMTLVSASPASISKAGTLVARSAPAPPASYERQRCEISDQSPGASNVQVSADALAALDQNCVHDGGESTQLRHDDGVRIYMHGAAGSFPCQEVANALYALVGACSANIDNDVRTGGVIWVTDATAGTYLSTSL